MSVCWTGMRSANGTPFSSRFRLTCSVTGARSMVTASPVLPSRAAVTALWAVRLAAFQASWKASVVVKESTAWRRKSRTVSWSGPASICFIAPSVMRSVTVLCTSGSEASGATAST